MLLWRQEQPDSSVLKRSFFPRIFFFSFRARYSTSQSFENQSFKNRFLHVSAHLYLNIALLNKSIIWKPIFQKSTFFPILQRTILFPATNSQLIWGRIANNLNTMLAEHVNPIVVRQYTIICLFFIFLASTQRGCMCDPYTDRFTSINARCWCNKQTSTRLHLFFL